MTITPGVYVKEIPMPTDTKPQHSPTPWSVRGNDIYAPVIGHIAEVGYSGFYSIAPVAEANAAHIVRCVNAHDALVEALEAVMKAWCHEAKQRGGIMDEHVGAYKQARAALAQAKG